MNRQIEALISEHEREGDFLHAPLDDDALRNAESELGVELPAQYVDFLRRYGHGGIGGVTVLGVGLDGSMIFAEETEEYRPDGLPDCLVAVESCDEWLYCIDCSNGKVVSWSPYDNDGVIEAYKDFDSYLLDRLNDAIENM
ncbi:SMI1/KNR4 family protein [Olsenella uli]|uniref:SMI1/KNR4 family protein n=1 Tax=Olsenella uli TaxID=133926 RepID=UPI003D79738E